MKSALLAFIASVALLAGLVGALYWTRNPDRTEPLIVYCAEALRPSMTVIAEEYQRDYKQKVELRFGSSSTILTSFEKVQKGDLFLPADDSYIQTAVEHSVVRSGEIFNLARMKAVIVVSPKFAGIIKTWDDFLGKDVRIGLGHESTAITKVLKGKLEEAKLWDALIKHKPSMLGNVNDVLNSVKLGSVDAGIVWDAVAHPHPELKPFTPKELETVEARVQIALAKSTKQRDNALHFLRYLRASDKGSPHLEKQGFTEIEKRGPMDERPELVLHAGAMLRPAIDEAVTEFEKRENCRVIRVYNGCGLLVSQMQTGETPDVYFSCDMTFMNQVNDRFDDPTKVSTNQLVIVLRKGNPNTYDENGKPTVTELADLGKSGLRLGVGHENNCALGAITKQTFVAKGVYANVIKNIKVTSPTGDMLINQLRAKSLDVVVAYRSNVAPFDDLEGFPVEKVTCAQPIAISKSTSNPEMSKRLTEFLRTAESRERFEKLGFGWEVKEVESKKK